MSETFDDYTMTNEQIQKLRKLYRACVDRSTDATDASARQLAKHVANTLRDTFDTFDSFLTDM